ncbi:MAG: imidazole glycerol phosphate synthase subunit HisF [Candidatus Omnitrophica bacterium]|nr:imidazole glycerol phosphate synthase subunit HisF [Candidatus Omnitrophota bacterium]
MLRRRVIPVVLLDGYSVVKTIQFNIRRNLGNPITVARIYNTRDVDELILLDIDASKEGRCIDLHTIEEVALECFMPLTVGGGLKTCEDIENVLKKGADKVVLNTAALKNPDIVKKSSLAFGSQCIVVSIDVKKNRDGYGIFSHSGYKTHKDLIEWCKELACLGAGEFLINSVDLDGKMAGYDYGLIEKVAKVVNIPVIACGGASKPDNCSKAIHRGACAVAAASMFHFTEYTPNDCKKAMKTANIPVR